MIAASRIASRAFIGRQAELAFLHDALATDDPQAPRGVFVGGDAGIGKTRLVTQFVKQVRREGGIALVGSCLRLYEANLPFAPMTEALRALVVDEPRDEIERALRGVAPDLSALVPQLDPDPAPQHPRQELGSAQARLFGALLVFLERLARTTPTVLVVEDTHWADRSTLDLLTFLVRNTQRPQLLVLGTYRTDELHPLHHLRSFLAELDHSRRAHRVEIGPLSEEDVVAQVRSITGDRPLGVPLEEIVARAEGNPLYVEEILETDNGGVGSSTTDLMRARVEAATADTREILRLAAVAGRSVGHELLARLTGLSEGALQNALRDAVDRHLLVLDVEKGRYRFRHPLVREAIYEDLHPAERAHAHEELARTLTSLPELGDQESTTIAELAYHWSSSHHLAEALEASVRAGFASFERLAFAEAAVHFGRALELWPRVTSAAELAGLSKVRLMGEAAEATYHQGYARRAAALVRDAIDEAEGSSPEVVAGLYERLGQYLWDAGDGEGSLVARREAVSRIRTAPASPGLARALAAEAQSLLVLSRYTESETVAQEAILVARSTGARADEGHALNTLGSDLAGLGHFDQAVKHLDAARAIAEELGSWSDIQRAYGNLASTLDLMGNLDDSAALMLEGIEALKAVGLAGSLGRAQKTSYAMILAKLGRYGDVDDLTRSTRLDEHDLCSAMVHQAQGRADCVRGRFESAAGLLDSARRSAAEMHDPELAALSAEALCELATWTGDFDRAPEIFSWGKEATRGGEDVVSLGRLLQMGTRVAADVARQLSVNRGQAPRSEWVEKAELWAHECRSLISSTSDEGFVRFPELDAAVVTADAEETRARGEAAPDRWAAAASSWQQLHMPYETAYCRWREAEAHVSGGNRSRALRPLRLALARATSLGAEPLVREIKRLALRARLDATGTGGAGEETGARVLGSHPLTHRELEVLRCLGRGMTDREIGSALSISPKTAAVHVTHIREKLDAPSRVDAAAYAFELGLVEEETTEPEANPD